MTRRQLGPAYVLSDADAGRVWLPTGLFIVSASLRSSDFVMFSPPGPILDFALILPVDDLVSKDVAFLSHGTRPFRQFPIVSRRLRPLGSELRLLSSSDAAIKRAIREPERQKRLAAYRVG